MDVRIQIRVDPTACSSVEVEREPPYRSLEAIDERIRARGTSRVRGDTIAAALREVRE